MKKSISVILCITMVAAFFTVGKDVQAVTVRSADKVSGSQYTESKELAKKLDKIFTGKAGLSTNAAGTKGVSAPIGCCKLTGNRGYFVKSGSTGEAMYGWQCYIYANAVYNTLFGEYIKHGHSLLYSKKIISGGARSLSYSKLKNAGVKCGAYLRTTVNGSGSFNAEQGHSMIILSYDQKGITYLDANGDNCGSVLITTDTWSEFNRTHLSRLSRIICHVIQPTDKYYDSLYAIDDKEEKIEEDAFYIESQKDKNYTGIRLAENLECDFKQYICDDIQRSNEILSENLQASVKKINSKKESVQIKWSDACAADGYQIQYAASKDFKDSKTITVRGSDNTAKTISGLDSKSDYYIRIRTYKTFKVNGDSIKTYMSWSDSESVKTK